MKRFLEFAGQGWIDRLSAILCAGILIALQNTSPVVRAEWLVFDKLTKWTAASRPLDPSLALVVIDDRSIDALGSPQSKQWAWPWPRGAYADMIAYLKAAGAREIWIDLVFYTPDNDSFQDDELRAVAAAAGNVRFGQGEGSTSIFQPTFNVHLPETTGKEPVIHTDIAEKHLLAWPLPFNDLALQKQDNPVTAAAPLVAEGEKILKRLPAEDRVDETKLRSLWVTGPPPPLAERFRDKIVYIGVSAQSGYDLKLFPVGSREPSVMIHVVARSNELQGGFFREIPNGLRDLFVLACALLAAQIFRWVPQFSRSAVCLLVVAAVLGLVTYVLFSERIWIRPVLMEAALAGTFVTVTSINYVREGRKRRKTEELFGKFVSRKIVDRLVARPDALKLGGEKAELTVMFSDLSGFTSLSESMPSDVLLRVLNTYLNEMSELIHEQEGTLDKYIGDAIMAFWGAPDVSADHAWRACHAALACHRRLAELSPVWEETYGVKLKARIGINTDEMTVGMVGSERLHNYSVIGDAVNLASRLEGANKHFGTSIMISQRTVDLSPGKIEVRPIALLQVKGKTKAVTVYELLARVGELNEGQRAIQHLFGEGWTAYLRRDWAGAEACFSEVLQLNPDDALAAFYLKETRVCKLAPPGSEWDGVFRLDEK